MAQLTERTPKSCEHLNVLQDRFRVQARELIYTVRKLTDGVGPAAGDKNCLLDNDALALGNELVLTLHELAEKQLDVGGWFKKPIDLPSGRA